MPLLVHGIIEYTLCPIRDKIESVADDYTKTSCGGTDGLPPTNVSDVGTQIKRMKNNSKCLSLFSKCWLYRDSSR